MAFFNSFPFTWFKTSSILFILIFQLFWEEIRWAISWQHEHLIVLDVSIMNSCLHLKVIFISILFTSRRNIGFLLLLMEVSLYTFVLYICNVSSLAYWHMLVSEDSLFSWYIHSVSTIKGKINAVDCVLIMIDKTMISLDQFSDFFYSCSNKLSNHRWQDHHFWTIIFNSPAIHLCIQYFSIIWPPLSF